MTFKEEVNRLLEGVLQERSSLFLIDLKVDDSYKINIVLDGDNGVTLQDCVDVSRAIDANLDGEKYDFSLEVASAGLSSPLKLVRQYKKNIGRNLKVKTTSAQEIEALLTEANDERITLKWKAREPKKIGKGKETVEKTVNLLYSEIKEATVIVLF
ncbi:ribosome assembly cofactor RimP [Flavobacterium sp. J27]|uniref:ribosome assembly cofactor RimP n=1 Tax=Flavobacterium sp. J27 TaxID=2060419 RepID=UPI0010320DEB|nr:ribosome assembly cofactor RimP [Flavobacterium sp. J27]